ncbi:MAG: CHC2 zinc finger domain-containing protein, partial [Candidatus Acidiferrales bacterium]
MKGLLCTDIARAALGEPLRQKGHELDYRCPVHDDQHPSLKVNPDKNNWMCGPCGKSGGPWALAAFLSGRDPSDKPAITESLRELGLLSRRGEPTGSRSRIVATYDYTDENGELLYQNVRYEPKDFKQRRPDGKGGWMWNLHGVRRVLYRLPKVLAASDVIIVEGEKDANTGDTLGLTATTSGSTGTWRNEFSEIL